MTNQHQKTRASDLWTSLLRALVILTKFGVLFLSLVSNLAVQLLLFLSDVDACISYENVPKETFNILIKSALDKQQYGSCTAKKKITVSTLHFIKVVDKVLPSI